MGLVPVALGDHRPNTHPPRENVSGWVCRHLFPPLPQRVQFVSEPCSLSVNGVIFGLTSTDLLFHMGAEEISR